MQPKKLLAGAFNHLSESRYGYMLYNINDMYMGGSLDRYGEFSEGEVEIFRQVAQPLVVAPCYLNSNTIGCLSRSPFAPNRAALMNMVCRVALVP